MALSEFLRVRGFFEWEGNCGDLPGQMEHLRSIAKNPNIKSMLEIGFNAGHSADVLLSENPDLKLISYDLGEHPYTVVAKEYIDEKYPGRHTLVLGDSKETLPRSNLKYDCFFIDGGHDYASASSDMKECARLANPYALVIMDDVCYSTSADYTIAPTKVWGESIDRGLVCQIFKAEYGQGRGMGVGFFSGAAGGGKISDLFQPKKRNDFEGLYRLVEESIKELEKSKLLPDLPLTSSEESLYLRIYKRLTSALAILMISSARS